MKYRAVLEAQQAVAGQLQSARAFLVLEAKLPESLRAMRNNLGIELFDESNQSRKLKKREIDPRGFTHWQWTEACSTTALTVNIISYRFAEKGGSQVDGCTAGSSPWLIAGLTKRRQGNHLA